VLLGVAGLVLILAGATGAPASTATERGTTTVVITARAVAVGSVLAAADVVVASVPSGVSTLTGVLRTAGDAIGHRVAVALPAGVPLLGPLLLDPVASQPGRRVVRVQIDPGALPPQLQAGQLVDVLASIADGQADGGRLVAVASGSLVSLSAGGGEAAASSSTPPAATLTLDVDVAGAERLLWAESFAKSLHVLARPVGDGIGPPADVDTLASGGRMP
jgi:Flp pilus assembly protein CpaB